MCNSIGLKKDEGESHSNSMAEAQDFDAMSEGDSSDEDDDVRDEGDDAMSTITVDEDDNDDMSEGSIIDPRKNCHQRAQMMPPT